ncbi:unnamed protein product [Clonostachys byssicola]|uniref:Uncharacterized protein n=1 Tax=Clonostachys byssicola TaxID=160290 RepID=A0A9N9YB48_9HYPO|nr:unnamed protein product [Clonostachys byssicola]
MNFNRDKTTTTPLTQQNLNGVSSKSNLGHYLAKDQNFEKVSQGLTTKGRDSANYLSQWQKAFDASK